MRPIAGTITDPAVTRSLEGGGNLPDVLVTKSDPWHYEVLAVTTRAKAVVEDGVYDAYDFKRLFDGLIDSGLVVR